MPHPADETSVDIAKHGWLPLAIACAVLLGSVILDVSQPGKHWTQRSGSIVTVLGAYVAYRDAKQSMKFINGSMFMNFELPYRRISAALVVVGTIVWGYADLIL